MNFKLSYKIYIYIKSFVWVAYSLFVLNVLYSTDDLNLVYGVLLGGVMMTMTVLPFLNNWYKKGRPILLDWFRLATFLFIILNFFLLIDKFNNELSSFKDYTVKMPDIIPSLLIVFVGLIGLKISEVISASIWFNKVKKNLKQNKYNFKNFYLFSLISLLVAVIQIYLMISGEVGYGTMQENTTSDFSFLFQTVFTLSSIILSVLAVFKYLYSYSSRYFNMIFGMFFGIQIVYGFLSGMKESIISPCIIVLIPYLLGGFKISKKSIYFGLLAIILIYPLNDNYRLILNNMPSLKKNEAFGLALYNTVNVGFSDNLNQGKDSFSDRLSLFPYLVYSYDKESEWNYYKSLDRYAYLPVAWILPRVIIPDKPKSETGAILNEKVAGVKTNSISVTTYGWAYFEGGYSYVLFLFILFGIFISYFEYNLGIKSYLGLILYIQILIVLLKVESDIYFLISGILQTVLINFIFFKIFIKETKTNSKEVLTV